MIRTAKVADTDAIRRLVHDAYGHYVARIGKQPGPMLDDYAHRIADEQVWVLEDGGEPVGIIVLEDGHITEEGAHRALLKQKGTYARLWKHQSGGFLEE